MDKLKEEYLDCIYKNAEMGVIGIDNVLDKVNSNELKDILLKEKEEYLKICKKAKEQYQKMGKEEEKIGLIAIISTNIMSEVMLINNKDDKKIVKMMLEGTNKGIIEIVEKINEYDQIDKKISYIAHNLYDILLHNVEELKKYL